MFLEEFYIYIYKREISMIVQLNEKGNFIFAFFDVAFLTFFFSFHGVK